MDSLIKEAYRRVHGTPPPEHFSDEEVIKGFIEVIANPSYLDQDFAKEVAEHIAHHMDIDSKLLGDVSYFAGNLLVS